MLHVQNAILFLFFIVITCYFMSLLTFLLMCFVVLFLIELKQSCSDRISDKFSYSSCNNESSTIKALQAELWVERTQRVFHDKSSSWNDHLGYA